MFSVGDALALRLRLLVQLALLLRSPGRLGVVQQKCRLLGPHRPISTVAVACFVVGGCHHRHSQTPVWETSGAAPEVALDQTSAPDEDVAVEAG